MASQRISIAYRLKTIIARKTDAGWEARAFDNKTPASKRHVQTTSDDAILAVKAVLDHEEAEEHYRRGEDGFPTADLVKQAFMRVHPNDGQMAMLKAHLNAPDQILTATQLAVAAGKDNYGYANLQYGLLARDLAKEMEFDPLEVYASTSEPIWTYALATGVSDGASAEPTDEYVEWRWKLRPQLVEALTSLGI